MAQVLRQEAFLDARETLSSIVVGISKEGMHYIVVITVTETANKGETTVCGDKGSLFTLRRIELLC